MAFDILIKPSIISNTIQYTYDYTKNNRIKGKFRSRLDRVYTNIENHEHLIDTYELVGCEYVYGKCPSDHFGVMVKIN